MTIDQGPGRLETRRVRTTTGLHDYLDWPHLAQAIRIDRPVPHQDGRHPHDDVAWEMTDLTPDQAGVADLGQLVRGHWGIATRLHGVRDVDDEADRSPVRTGNGPRVMSPLRNTAISVIRRAGATHVQRALDPFHRHPADVARLVLG